jgi:epoxyqueuosine reductase
VCLEVCPWNRFAAAGRRVLLDVRGEIATLTLREILELSPERFATVFRQTAVKRLKLAGLLRNACVVAGNTDARDCLEAVLGLALHPLPVVRAHAVWAVFRLGAGVRLAAAHAAETDAAVLAEYATEWGETISVPLQDKKPN